MSSFNKLVLASAMMLAKTQSMYALDISYSHSDMDMKLIEKLHKKNLRKKHLQKRR